MQLWRRPDVQPGYKRLTWTSAYGKPLYVDVGGASQQQAETLQSRFRQVVTSSQPSEGLSDSSIEQLPCIPAPTYTGTTSSRSDQSTVSAKSSSGFEPRAPITHSLNPTAYGESRPRYLLLCITTRESVSYRPIDLTNVTHDQFLF